MNKTVTDITPKLQKDLRKLRVAAYARVSCDKDAMLHSLDAQIHYYRNLICGNPDWEFAGIYADEAKTSTKESREQFQQLLSDCRAGNIDMVITKSVSRFLLLLPKPRAFPSATTANGASERDLRKAGLPPVPCLGIGS